MTTLHTDAERATVTAHFVASVQAAKLGPSVTTRDKDSCVFIPELGVNMFVEWTKPIIDGVVPILCLWGDADQLRFGINLDTVRGSALNIRHAVEYAIPPAMMSGRR